MLYVRNGGNGILATLSVGRSISANSLFVGGTIAANNYATNPSASQNVLVLTNGTSTFSMYDNSSGSMQINCNNTLTLASGNTDVIIIPTNQCVGIGKTPSYKLDVSGDINCTGSFRVNGTAIPTSFSLTNVDLWGSSYSYRSILQKSSTYGNGVEFFDNQQLNDTNTVLSLNTNNGWDPVYIRMFSPIWNNTDATGTSYGQSMILGYHSAGYWYSGGHFSTAATAAGGYSEADRLHLSVGNGYIPYVSLNSKYDQLHFRTTGLGDLNTNYSPFKVIGHQPFRCTQQMQCTAFKATSYTRVGTSTDTDRLISALDGSQATGSAKYITWGYQNSNLNHAELAFYLAGSGSTSNRLDLGFYGGSVVSITGTGRLGIGTQSPSCPLDVATGDNVVTTTTNIAINTYGYTISTGSTTNYGGGPVSVNMSFRVRGNAWIQNAIYATSDRRMKENISEIDFDLDHFSKLRPVSFNWKNEQTTKLGLIVQEVMGLCGEAINLLPNERMQKESDDDIEGYQMTMDYTAISMLNTVAVKKLIDRVEGQQQQIDELKALVERMIARPVVKKVAQYCSIKKEIVDFF